MRTLLGVFIVLVFVVADAAAAVLHVPGDHTTIQAAVNAAAQGDTVQVAAGVYEEQVVITSDLALIGAGRGLTTIQAPAALPHAVGADEYRAVVCVDDDGATVTITSLTVDGLGRQPATGRFVGVCFDDADGAIVDVDVLNLHHTPVDAAISGIGILVRLGTPSGGVDFGLEDVFVRRFQKAGIVMSGTGAVVEMTNIEVDPETIVSASVQNGIELTRIGDARLTDCTVRNVSYDGIPHPEYTACGVFGNECTAVTIVGSTFTGCHAAVYLVGTPCTVLESTFSLPTPGLTPAHGLVSVGAINLAEADGSATAIPVPSPTLSSMFGGNRPPVVYEVIARDCLFDGGDVPASRGVAVRTFSARGQRFTGERCHVTGWGTGTLSLEDQAYFGAVYARFNGCRIADNATIGVLAMTATPLDARGCQWGDVSGPYHATANPDGLGNAVSDHVIFDPWLIGNVAPLPLPQAISLADTDGFVFADTVTVEYLGGAEAAIYGFSAQLTWNTEVVRGVCVERPSRGAFHDAVIFQVLPITGAATVDAALGGNHDGIESGPLFTVCFEAIGTPDWTSSPLQLQLNYARDKFNAEIDGLVTDDGIVVVDLQPPVIDSVVITNETLEHTDDFAKDGDLLSVVAMITDGDPLFGRGDIRGIGANVFGAPSLILPPDRFQNGIADWDPRPTLVEPLEGDQWFLVEALDPSGNASLQVGDNIFVDNTPPDPITGLSADTGHNQLVLSWDDASANDMNYRRTVVRANRWLTYPFYDGDEPGYPADIDEGEDVYTGVGTDTVLQYAADGSARGIFYLGAMVEDMAGHVSVLGPTATARATNYRLGDIRGALEGDPGDGVIDANDLLSLDATFGLERAAVGFDGECDVALADSTGPVIPIPDEIVDLDDLMLVAMRYDLVGTPVGPSDADCRLGWSITAPDTFVLSLTDTCPRMKGLSVVAGDAEVSWSLVPGPLLQAQPGPWFLHQGVGGCRAYLAMLGPQIGIVGQGELLRLIASAPASPGSPVFDVRDVNNATLDVMPTAVGDRDLPRLFAVSPPYPNPFNPNVTITFALPSAQAVRLDVFSLDGNRVRRLLHADMPAGHHTARWLGRDDDGRPLASGTYVYRLVAGPWSATGKLGLLK